MLLSTTDPSVRQVLNLRPHPGDVLRPVGAPLLLPLAHRTPVGALTIGGVRRLVCAGGTALYTHPATSAIGTPAVVPTPLPAAPDCALPLSDDRLLVMTAAGTAEVVANGTQVSVARPPEFKDISLTATAYGPLSETVDGLAMDSGVDDLYARLADVEARLLSRGKAARAQLHLRVAGDGRYCSPVVCGYRLRNRRGDEIFRSQPFLLGEPADEPTIELYSPDNVTIKSWEQSVNTWKIHLRIEPSASLSDAVGNIEIVAMPQLNLVDPSQGGSAVLTRHTSSSLPFARLRISEGLGESAQNARVAALAARLFDSGTVIHAVSDPIGLGVDIDINCGAPTSYASDYATLQKALSSKLPTPPSYLNLTMGLPHSFTATCCCRSGDTVLWGDVSPVAYPGYRPEMLAAAFGEAKAWSYTMLTMLSDGRRIYTEGSSTGPIPTRLNALVSYPHPDATELRIRISWSGGAWRRNFTLTPSACGRFAYSLSADRCPITVENNSGSAITNPGAASVRLSNVVIAAHVSAPTVALDCIEIPDGAVRAIVERPGNDTAWDHTRSRFFIGTRSGVHALGVNISADRPTHTLRRLSASGIRTRSCIAPMP